MADVDAFDAGVRYGYVSGYFDGENGRPQQSSLPDVLRWKSEGAAPTQSDPAPSDAAQSGPNVSASYDGTLYREPWPESSGRNP